MKVGDLVQCRGGTEELFWYRDGVGVVTSIIPNTWGNWTGSAPSHIIKVIWTDGMETTISTRWLEVINVELKSSM